MDDLENRRWDICMIDHKDIHTINDKNISTIDDKEHINIIFVIIMFLFF